MEKKQVKQKAVNVWEWLKKECKDWKTFLLFVIVLLVVYFPVWGCGLIYYWFRIKWCKVVAYTCFAFWMGPFTPFFPLCIGLTLGIKKTIEVIIRRKRNRQK